MIINRNLILIKLDKLVLNYLSMINKFNINDHIKLCHRYKEIHHILSKHMLSNHSSIPILLNFSHYIFIHKHDSNLFSYLLDMMQYIILHFQIRDFRNLNMIFHIFMLELMIHHPYHNNY